MLKIKGIGHWHRKGRPITAFDCWNENGYICTHWVYGTQKNTGEILKQLKREHANKKHPAGWIIQSSSG